MEERIRQLETASDFEEILRLSKEGPVMILKHSTRCPTSTYAYQEFRSYSEDAAERGIDCAMVLVVENRALSREMSEVLGVRHQSPQAILLKDRRAVWNDSHEGVNAAALMEAEALAAAS